VGEIRSDPRHASRGVLDPLVIVGRGNRRLRRSSHERNDKKDKSTRVKVQN
jgi:hypothetical protein